MTPRVMAWFSAFLAVFFASIGTWLALRGGSVERSAVGYWVMSGVGWILAVVFIRAALIGKLPKWFENFLDAQ